MSFRTLPVVTILGALEQFLVYYAYTPDCESQRAAANP